MENYEDRSVPYIYEGVLVDRINKILKRKDVVIVGLKEKGYVSIYKTCNGANIEILRYKPSSFIH